MKTRGFERISKEQWDKDRDWQFHCEIEDVLLPKRATRKSAGYDFFSPLDFTLAPDEEIKFPTGIKVYLPDNEYLDIRPRSGHGFKHYVRLANTTGVIDADYYNNPDNEGHIWIKIRNESRSDSKPLTVKFGDAICQGIFLEYKLADGDSFDNGEERISGIGSTNK